MQEISQDAIAQFRELRSKLAQQYPDAATEASHLASDVVDPRSADAERIWRVMWDKPLYANTKVSIADRAISLINDVMTGAWRLMDNADGPYATHRIGPGFRKSSFEVRGVRAKDIVERGHVAPHRLLAIIGAGRALGVRAGRNPFPFADLTRNSIFENVDNLKHEIGFGWGPVTILHFLTDLGLASKPDLHLVRTMKALGLWPKIKPDNPSMSDAISIAGIVQSLAEGVMGDVSPPRFCVNLIRP
jgi:hypothetical protein